MLNSNYKIRTGHLELRCVKAGLKEIGIHDNIPKDHDCFGNSLFEITHNVYVNT